MCAKAVIFISILTLAIYIDGQMKWCLDPGSVSVVMLINPKKRQNCVLPSMVKQKHLACIKNCRPLHWPTRGCYNVKTVTLAIWFKPSQKLNTSDKQLQFRKLDSV